MREIGRPAIVGALVVAGAAIYFGGGTAEDVQAAAGDVACRGKICAATLVTQKRTLFGWELVYETVAETNSRNTVSCKRALWVVGEHVCSLTRTDEKPVRGFVTD